MNAPESKCCKGYIKDAHGLCSNPFCRRPQVI